MIRAMKEEDCEAVVDIWLRASLQSHAFVEEGYWESRVEDMRNVYPVSYTHLDVYKRQSPARSRKRP